MDDWHFISLTRRTTKIEETEKQKQRQRDSKTKRWRKPFLSASICCCRAERGRCVWVCVCLYVCDRESVMVRINSDGPFDAWLVPVFLFLLLMLQSFDPPPHSSLSLYLSARLPAILTVMSSLSSWWLSFYSQLPRCCMRVHHWQLFCLPGWQYHWRLFGAQASKP